jgi:hypothetical protein
VRMDWSKNRHVPSDRLASDLHVNFDFCSVTLLCGKGTERYLISCIISGKYVDQFSSLCCVWGEGGGV